MHRRNVKRSMMMALAIIAGVFLLNPGLIFAGVGASDTPTATSPVTVGDTGVIWHYTIENASTNPNHMNNMRIESMFFITACGSSSVPGACIGLNQEPPNEITVDALATGVGGACTGRTFIVTPTVVPNKTAENEYEFTVVGLPVILGPSGPGGDAATCIVRFTVNINAAPVNDSSGAPGMQTSQHARVLLRDTETNETGGGSGTSTVTVNKKEPKIVTAPDPTKGVVGTELNDCATLSDGINPTGSITFNLYGVNDPTCGSAPIFTKTVTVNGNGTYCTAPGGYTATAPGVHHWIATYSGDANNNGVSSVCADEAVPVMGIVTTPNPTKGVVGTVLNDCATLSGGIDPTGSITFNLYGVSDPTCGSVPIFTKTVTVNGNGTYCTDPGGYVTTAPGVYHWIATYSGDANDPSVASICANEAVPVMEIVTAPDPTKGVVGAVLNDCATISGGIDPTGIITCKLFGPNNQTCSDQGPSPVFTKTMTINGNGTYCTTPGGYTTTIPGVYHWICTYSGDANDPSVTSICANEAVPVIGIVTAPDPTSGPVGTVLNDCATLSGGIDPTGTITFNLYGVNDPTCGSAPIFTKTVTINGNGTYCTTPDGYTTTAPGVYHWIATYSGDANDPSVSSICADEAVSVINIVTAPDPTKGVVGTVLNDCVTLSGGIDPTGSIICKLFGPNNQTCSDQGPSPVFTKTMTVNGNGTYCTAPGGYTTTAPGVYHWICTYTGDANDPSVTSICANEAVPIIGIVTAPDPTSGPIGAELKDRATLLGGIDPTGTITFNLYDVNDPTCSGAPIFTDTVPVTNTCLTLPGCSTQNGFTAPAQGTYHWRACYSGDANNSDVCSNCALEAVVIGRTPRAGEDPFVAVVGNDIEANRFYLSPKHELFLYDQTLTGLPIAGEVFTSSSTEPAYPEICDINGVILGPGSWDYQGLPTRLVGLENDGWFQWTIRLPKNLNALNICFECGVVKPNTFQVFGFDAVLHCAANTGERQFPGGICTRDDVNPGQNPVIAGAQPTITAIAAPGPNNSFTPFNLTAYRNPGTYGNLAQPMTNNQALQVLNGSSSARVMLKSCLDKCINIKIPVTGQINALGQVEEDLGFGDLITITMTIPRTNTVDIYCGAESARLTGIGEVLVPLP